MSTNPNVVILNKAWALLWNQSSSYYLPKIFANGGTFGGTVIPPLGSVKVPDIDPIPLWSSDFWGNVSITLSAMTLDGLPSIQNVSFAPSSDATSVQATVAFGQLKFSGSYEVDGTGIIGCAMDLAQGLAYAGGAVSARDAEQDVQAIPPDHLDLARSYRDKLVQSQNGSNLVATYYDRNDTVNRILNRDNAFTMVWPGSAPANPPDHNTVYYMQVTANSTANPDNPNYTVGGNNTGYLNHSGYMQGMLIGTCQYYEDHDPEYAEDYRVLARSTATFQGYTNPYPNPMTADEVMNSIVNTTPKTEAELAAVPMPAAVREGMEAAARDFDEMQNSALARQVAREQQGTTYKSHGNFQFSFTLPTLTFNGTVAISGIPPDQNLTVDLKTLTAAIPNIKIDLLTGSDRNLTSEAQSRINDAEWFQKTLGTKVNAKLGSSEVRTYLANMFNQAILNILGG